MTQLVTSCGSDGHSMALTESGEVFSWGDGDYGKLGHGNSSTQKYPKLIQGPLQGKVCAFFLDLKIISCTGTHDCYNRQYLSDFGVF